MPFNFTSPETVERKIQLLDDSWEALARSYAGDSRVEAEIKRFRQWRDKVRGSLTSSFVPSSIAAEYEQWVHRYKVTFENAQKAHPNVKATAPLPQAIAPPPKTTSPWIYAIVAGSIALGLTAVAFMRK